MMAKEEQITELLDDWNKGNKGALDRLIPLVEAELKRIVHNFMRREKDLLKRVGLEK